MRVILRFLLALSLTLAAGYAVLRQGAAIMERASAEKQDGPRRGRGPGARDTAVEAVVAASRIGDLTPSIRAWGWVESRRRAPLRLAVGETVAWVSADFTDGARLAEGEALLRLDDREARAALADAEAARARAALALAETRRKAGVIAAEVKIQERMVEIRGLEAERAGKLVARGGGARATLETVEAALLSARNAADASRAALAANMAQEKLDALSLEAAEREVAQSDVDESDGGALQWAFEELGEQRGGAVEHVRDAAALPAHGEDLGAVALAVAGGARQGDVGECVHRHAFVAPALAHFAATLGAVERERGLRQGTVRCVGEQPLQGW